MITRFHVRNYKALRDVTLDLDRERMHVLIGPNDAGKTSVLEAIAALCRSVDHPLAEAFAGRWEGRELVWNGGEESDGVVGLQAMLNEDAGDYELACTFRPRGRGVVQQSETITVSSEDGSAPFHLPQTRRSDSWVYRAVWRQGSPEGVDSRSFELVHDALTGVRLHRWVPELLSLPVAPYKRRAFDLESTGFGLALCLEDILGDDRDRFNALEERFRRIFTGIAQIKFRPEGAYTATPHPQTDVPLLTEGEGKGLHFQLRSGTVIPASQVSDGALLVLAYLAILMSPAAPRVLLVEEPENGVHPALLKNVLSILRELIAEQDRTQVILTTHSPYVLDLFEPQEVTLLTKEANGEVRAHRLSESETVKSQIDTFTLGEIWTAEGDDSLAGRKSADQGNKL